MENGGTAFPLHPDMDPMGEGMSLRDYFAGQALAGLMANGELEREVQRTERLDSREIAEEFYAHCSYKIADAMLNTRKKDKVE